MNQRRVHGQAVGVATTTAQLYETLLIVKCTSAGSVKLRGCRIPTQPAAAVSTLYRAARWFVVQQFLSSTVVAGRSTVGEMVR